MFVLCSLAGKPNEFRTGQDLYSNAEAREVPKIQALQKAVKRLIQETKLSSGHPNTGISGREMND